MAETHGNNDATVVGGGLGGRTAGAQGASSQRRGESNSGRK